MMAEHPENHTISFVVDDDTVTTTEHRLTVYRILELSSNAPPEDFVLIEFRGQSNEQVRHEDLTEEIRVHQGQRFSALFRKGTPFSWA